MWDFEIGSSSNFILWLVLSWCLIKIIRIWAWLWLTDTTILHFSYLFSILVWFSLSWTIVLLIIITLHLSCIFIVLRCFLSSLFHQFSLGIGFSLLPSFHLLSWSHSSIWISWCLLLLEATLWPISCDCLSCNWNILYKDLCFTSL